MIPLTQYLIEGGLAGHMSHIIDCEDYTCADLKNLIKDLFSGNITDITEKTDGLQIMVSMDLSGELKFYRNIGDLESGGMTLETLKTKFSKPEISEAYYEAGKLLTKILNKISVEFFHPNEYTLKCLNCECLNTKTENVIPYGRNIVDIHNISIFHKDGNEKWNSGGTSEDGLDKISQACKDVENTWVSPKIIISVTEESDKLVQEFYKELDKIFNGDDTMTIEEWKKDRFQELTSDDETSEWYWIGDSAEGAEILYDRWFNGKKNINLRILKNTYYPKYKDKLEEIEKSKKWRDTISEVLFPLDNLFLKIGNEAIKLCNNLLNSGEIGTKSIKEISQKLKDTVSDIKSSGVVSDQIKLSRELARFEALGSNPINATEGLVIKYNNRILKLTGTFAPLNQILGLSKYKK